MNFNQIETLIAVADAGSFSKAAAVMGISPQSLMQQVASVERELGIDVLQRDNRGVHPTEAGAVFVEQERQVLAAHKAAVESSRATANHTATLRIGMPMAVNPTFLLRTREQFRKAHPEVSVTHITRKRAEMPGALANGDVDLYMDISKLDTMPFAATKLFAVQQYCVIEKSDPLASLASAASQHLAGRIIGVWESPERYDVLTTSLGITTDKLHNLHRDLSAAISLCMAGGVLVTSIPVVQMLKSTLAVVPLGFDCQIVYATVHTKTENPLVDAFLDCARAVAESEDNPWKHCLEQS